MKFHEILRQRRLALGLTQEQLAQRLGVSAPAVNKWERNNSYPDITLLPPLARLLEVDLNTLLSFQEELTEEEIGAFANVLGERAQQEGCEAAFRLARDKLREYPNSDLLAYTAAQILDGALVLWKRGENDPEREQAWKGEILALYRRCADSGDRRVRERAERMLISQYMAQGELEQAEEQLARLPQEDPGTAHAGGHAPQETEAVGRGVAHSGAGAVPAGIRSPVYPHGFDGPGAGGGGQDVRAAIQ